ncbi:MAG: ATP-binding protein [Myxococcota bacterium]
MDQGQLGTSWAPRLAAGANEVLSLARTRDIRLKTLHTTLQEIARVSASALAVARTSVWLLRGTRLECTILVQNGESVPAAELKSLQLEIASCPKYIERLRDQLAIAIPSTATDSVCSGLEAYLAQYDVGAMLDVPLALGGELLGVICNEHVGGTRAWHGDEVMYGNLVATVVMSQLEAERRLRADLRADGTEARYAHLVESLPVAVYAFDVRTGSLEYVSPNIVQLGGLTQEQWLAQGGVRSWVACIDPEDRPAILLRFEQTLAETFDPDVTYRIRLPDGTRRFVRDRCSIVRDRLGRPIALHGMLADVTAEHEALLLIREHARRFDELLANSELGAVVLNLDGTVRSANEALRRIIGGGDWVGAAWFKARVASKDRARAEAIFTADVASGRVTPRTEAALLTASGEERPFLWTNSALRSADGSLEGVACLGVDLTDRDRHQAGQYHAQRLESLGQLSAAIAHDFNNALQVITATAEEMEHALGSRAGGSLEDHRAAVDHAKALVRSLLMFARKDGSAESTVAVDGQVRGSQPLLARIAGGHPLELQLDAEAAIVRIDPVQLNQVLVNLVSNAAHAMHGRAGQIRVRTFMGRADAALAPDLDPAQRYVCIAVEDQGIGIPTGLLATIFEPFFTSKADRGTGLGLATAQAIARRAGGQITVQSTVGEGANFLVWLPLNEGSGA